MVFRPISSSLSSSGPGTVHVSKELLCPARSHISHPNMLPSMLTREDRTRLLRETVLKSGNIDGHPAIRPSDPADLDVPSSRRDADAGLSGVESLLDKARRRSPSPKRQKAEPIRQTRDHDSERRVTELQNRLQRVETENRHLHETINTLHMDNQKELDQNSLLSLEASQVREMYDSLLSKHKALVESRSRAVTGGQISAEEWKEVNERVDVLINENDVLAERNKSAQRQVAELEDELSQTKKHAQNQSMELQQAQAFISTLKRDLNNTIDRATQAERNVKECAHEITAAQVENDKLVEEIRRREVDIKTYQGRVGDLRRSLEEVTTRYQAHVREAQALAARERDQLNSLKNIELERDEYKSKLAALSIEHVSLRENQDEVIKISAEFEQRIDQLEAKEVESYQSLQSEIQKAEEAKLEYEKALIREQQYQSEIQRLNEKLLEFPQRYRERTEQEIATMRAQLNSDKQQLTAEISDLETKCSQLQHQADRAIRDKRAAESELEKLSRHIPEEADRIALTIEELNTRLRNSERDKSAAMNKLER
ncbi:uncharacterized protein EV422DRAFT_204358 [Fimicolochytrium jonesii]|uniref:uncharacterized protein n=1 Tax=Fimicolochytrium jonesii TaxID=1396493 RepID=UPI0022FE6A33|nr:uncharacterized protein EV422DRAFT_204358 [Fimicolochytrium jonesii]KAI8818065.1 hypothetical protein EV422DRAFT_204358 [Fimicolochytrium jonesii]